MSHDSDAKQHEIETNKTESPSMADATLESFREFLREHYVLTRGMPVVGLCVGLLAAPILSLCKPLLGVPGLVLTALAVAGCWGLGRVFHGAVCVWHWRFNADFRQLAKLRQPSGSSINSWSRVPSSETNRPHQDSLIRPTDSMSRR